MRWDVWKRVLGLRGPPAGHLPARGQLVPHGRAGGLPATGHGKPGLLLQRGRRAAAGSCPRRLRAAPGPLGAERGVGGGARPGANLPAESPHLALPRGQERCRGRPAAGQGSGPRWRKPRGSRRGPSAPGPGGPTAAAASARVSQTGRSPSEGKFPQRPRPHTHFLHASARARVRARRRETGAPTARSGTLLRSQASFLLFGTKFPFLQKKKGGEGREGKVANSVFAPLQKQGRRKQ